MGSKVYTEGVKNLRKYRVIVLDNLRSVTAFYYVTEGNKMMTEELLPL